MSTQAKKVTYLHQYFMTPGMGGGTRSYEMARRLAAAGYDVTIITSGNEAKFPATPTKVEGFTVHWIPVKYDNSMSYVRRVVAFLEFSIKSLFASLKTPSDLVFATSTPLTICIPAIITQRRKRIPFIFEVRDLWPEMPIAVGAISNSTIIRLARWLENLAYRKANHIVTLSPGMTRGVIGAGVSPEKIIEIPNSCDLDRFSPDERQGLELRQRHEWLGNAPMLLYAGTLGKLNDVGWLAKVASELCKLDENVRVVVIGNGLQRESIRRSAEELGVLDKNFFMLDKTSKTEIVKWFQAATASISSFMPLKEMESNSANKFFDTLASGKPIVINYGGWQKKLIERENIGIAVRHDNLTEAAGSILELLRDEDRCRKLGTNARALAEREFSRDECANRLIKVIEELLTNCCAAQKT